MQLMSPQLPGDGDAQLSEKPVEDNSQQAFEAYIRRHERFKDILFRNAAQRMELRHRLDNLEQHLDRLQSSIGQFMEKPGSVNPVKSDAVKSDGSPKKPRGRRKRLQSTVNLDLEAAKDQIHALNLLSEELRENDREQEESGKSFDNATLALSTSLRRRGLVVDDDARSDVSLALTTPARSVGSIDTYPPVPVELEAYYAAVSHLQNMSERIGDLQVEKQEQWVRRGLEEDQGQVQDQSDSDFLRDWDETLGIAYSNYNNARTAVRLARELCDSLNIDIPIWAKVNSVGDHTGLGHGGAPEQQLVSPPNSVPANSRIGEIGRPVENISETVVQDQGSAPATPPVNNPLATERVAKWVEEVIIHPVNPALVNPVAWSEDVTEKDPNEPTPISSSWQEKVVRSARSTGDLTTANLYINDFGASSTRPSAGSLGAEQSLEMDCKVWDAAPLDTADLG